MASNANIISISLIKIIALLVCITGVHADPRVCQCSSLWIIWWVPGKPWGSGTVRIRGNILCNFVDNIKYASIYMCIDSCRNHSGSQNRTWKFPVSTCVMKVYWSSTGWYNLSLKNMWIVMGTLANRLLLLQFICRITRGFVIGWNCAFQSTKYDFIPFFSAKHK